MAYFDISTPSNSIRLDEKTRTAAVDFTVANTSGRPIRGRAIPHSDDPAVKEWLSVQGNAEREFEIGKIHDYTVKISPPESARPGLHNFRLDMVWVERPDDSLTTGQTVNFEVTEPRIVEPEWWRKPWVWIAAAAVVVLGIVAAFLFIGGDDPAQELVAVPDVVGLAPGMADDTLEAHGLDLAGLDNESSDVVKGLVARTDPAVDSMIARGTRVTLFVSDGPPMVPVPDVARDSIPQALNELAIAGLPFTLQGRADASVPALLVVSSEPAFPAEVSPGTPVTLFVSTGPPGSGGGGTTFPGPIVWGEVVLELNRNYEANAQQVYEAVHTQQLRQRLDTDRATVRGLLVEESQ